MQDQMTWHSFSGPLFSAPLCNLTCVCIVLKVFMFACNDSQALVKSLPLIIVFCLHFYLFIMLPYFHGEINIFNYSTQAPWLWGIFQTMGQEFWEEYAPWLCPPIRLGSLGSITPQRGSVRSPGRIQMIHFTLKRGLWCYSIQLTACSLLTTERMKHKNSAVQYRPR